MWSVVEDSVLWDRLKAFSEYKDRLNESSPSVPDQPTLQPRKELRRVKGSTLSTKHMALKNRLATPEGRQAFRSLYLTARALGGARKQERCLGPRSLSAGLGYRPRHPVPQAAVKPMDGAHSSCQIFGPPARKQ
jgi:hypothetical protein